MRYSIKYGTVYEVHSQEIEASDMQDAIDKFHADNGTDSTTCEIFSVDTADEKPAGLAV